MHKYITILNLMANFYHQTFCLRCLRSPLNIKATLLPHLMIVFKEVAQSKFLTFFALFYTINSVV